MTDCIGFPVIRSDGTPRPRLQSRSYTAFHPSGTRLRTFIHMAILCSLFVLLKTAGKISLQIAGRRMCPAGAFRHI